MLMLSRYAVYVDYCRFRYAIDVVTLIRPRCCPPYLLLMPITPLFAVTPFLR